VRVTLQQHRLDALLAVGHPDRAVADLVPLLVEHPYRESLWELRLRALYASGRQQAALAAFQELRRVLADELGVEPGPDVRRLHEQILAHDPALARSSPAAPAPVVPAGQRAVEVHLPRRRTRFVGRDAERRDLAALLAVDRVVTLVGPGGCGTTRLAIEVADDARGLFADGVWFVDLSAVADTDPDPAGQIADRIAATLGLDPGGRCTALAALRAFLADRSVLLLLDNCEQVVDGVAAGVDDVVEAAPAVVVLATSRQPLGVDGEIIRALGIGAGFGGDPDGGLHWTAEILRRQVALGIDDVADVLEQRAGHLDGAGRPDDAVRTLSASAARQRRIERAWPRTEGTTERLDRLRTSLGTARFTLAWRAGQHLDVGELIGPAQQPGSHAAR
jgi:hypothetical protein